MGFDERNGQLIMFGGYGGGTTYRNDTWEWTGTNWSTRSRHGRRCAHRVGNDVQPRGRTPHHVRRLGRQRRQWVQEPDLAVDGHELAEHQPTLAAPGAREREMAFDPSSGTCSCMEAPTRQHVRRHLDVRQRAWTQRFPAVTPGLLTQSSMAFDARLGTW